MPTDRCIKHRKDIEGVCNWCGARLCALCIAKRSGNKLYCEKCAINLQHFQKAAVPAPKPVSRDEPKSDPKFEPYY